MALDFNDTTYISVEDASAYAAVMGLTLPEGDDLQAVLFRAAILLDRLYGTRYPVLTEEVEEALGYAQVELAAVLEANSGVLPLGNPALKKSTLKLDGIETTVEYANADGYAVNPYDSINAILLPYLTPILDVEETGLRINRQLTMTRGA